MLITRWREIRESFKFIEEENRYPDYVPDFVHDIVYELLEQIQPYLAADELDRNSDLYSDWQP